jgi:signal transduction histidine kinase
MNGNTVTQVLLVDDSDIDYRIIQRYLARERGGDFHITWAKNFEQGLNAVETVKFDICLLDFQLGAENGLDFLAEAQRLHVAMPFILLTGQGDMSLAIEAMKLGAIDFIDKGELNPVILERSIRYAMKNFEIQEQLRRANESLEHTVAERTADLKRSNEDLERFAYIVSHELQLPLKTITSHIEKMNANAALAGEGEENDLNAYFVKRAYSGAKRMQSMISTVLAYSRVSDIGTDRWEVDLTQILKSVRDDLDAYIEEKGASIQLDSLPRAIGNPDLLHQLFKNLIGNALKFVDGRPAFVTVSGKQVEKECLIAVKDNGIGIPPDELVNIFKMFHRSNTETSVVGDGIGLALCKRIVDVHGGRIWVESEPGQGSIFYVTIPNVFSMKQADKLFSYGPPMPADNTSHYYNTDLQPANQK